MTIIKRLYVAIMLKTCMLSCESESSNDPNYWSDVICTTQSTRTVDIYGLTSNESGEVWDFFEDLTAGIVGRCEVSVRLKAYFVGKGENSEGRGKSLKEIDWPRMRRVRPRGRMTSPSRRSIDRSHPLRNSFKKNSVPLWMTNVIVLGDSNSLQRLLDAEESSSLTWNPQEHFIVLLISETRTTTAPMKAIVDILRTLWIRRQIHNVLLAVPGSTDRQLYSFDPFAKVAENEWGKIETITAETKDRVFELLLSLSPRRTRNLNGYNLTVGFFGQPDSSSKLDICKASAGTCYERRKNHRSDLDALTLNNLARRINFTVNALEPTDGMKFGHQLNNGTYVGTIGDVVHGRANLSFVSFFVKTYGRGTTKVLEFSTYVQFDRLCVIVPKAREIPKSARMYYVFEPTVWFSLLLFCVLVHLSWYFLRKHDHRRRRSIDLQTSVYDTFLVYCGGPVKLPHSLSERILLSAVSLSSITIVGLFTGIMYKSFAHGMYYSEIDLLSELERSGLPITYGSLGLKDVFNDESSDLGSGAGSSSSCVERNLRKRLRYAHGGVDEVANFRNTSALIREKYFSLADVGYIDPDGTHRLHLASECPKVYYLSYLLPKNSILRDRINELIGRLNQAGLPTMWDHIYVKTEMSRKKRTLKIPSFQRNNLTAFTLGDLQTCFYTLMIGLLLSTIVFLAERGYLRTRHPLKILCARI